MANRTVKEARNIHEKNPQCLVGIIVRSRIYASEYWKQQCFALTAELLMDKAMKIKFVGGVYGQNLNPTQFLCLTLKMLQIQPERDIIIEFIKNEKFKYVRALGALYLRLTGSSLDCYKYLEPLYSDKRKLRRQSRTGDFETVSMNEFIDELLCNDRVCDIKLPRIQNRSKISVLDEKLDDVADLNDGSGKSGDDLAGGGRSKKEERSGYKDREERMENSDKDYDEYYEKQRERDRKQRRLGRFIRVFYEDRDKESERKRYERRKCERALDDDILFDPVDPYPNDDDARYERVSDDDLCYDPYPNDDDVMYERAFFVFS